MKYIPLNLLAETIGAEVEQTVRAIKIATFNGVIRDTRVRTGRLRGNWQTTTGAPAANQIERDDKNVQGSDGGEAQSEVVRIVKGDSVDYLTNNLPYAGIWEERDGMVARNVARIERNIRNATNT